MPHPAPARDRALRWLAALATAAGAGYLVWRAVATSEGVHPALFWPLLGVEALAWAALLLAVVRRRPRASTPRLQPLDTEVDAVVVVDDEPLDLVEPTVIAVLALRGRVRGHLVDVDGREELRALAERFGLAYAGPDDRVDEPETVDDVLPDLAGRLVLVVPAGRVPAPDALLASSGGFALERLAAAELAAAVERTDVLIEAAGPAPRLEGALLLRVSALRAIGGPVLLNRATRADALARLQRAGYATTLIEEPVVASADPEGAARSGTTAPLVAAAVDRPLAPVEHAIALGARILSPVVLVVWSVLVGMLGLEPFAPIGPAGLAVAAAWIALQTVAASALRRSGSTDLDTAGTTLLALEPRVRGLLPGATAVDSDPDASTRSDLVRLVRTPAAIGAVLGVVLLVRGLDVALRAGGGSTLLPDLDGEALVVLAAGSLLGLAIVLRLLLRVRSRQRLHRRLRRFPTELPARVRGVTVACVDLHQRGAALILPRELVDGVGSLTFAVACRALTGVAAPAHGTMTITSQRPVDPEGTMLRIGGPVVWNDDESRRRVIAHCYVVEPYAARQRTWMRDAARVPVALEATLDGSAATCVDVSATGAAIVTRDGHWVLEDRVPVDVVLPTGEHAVGDFRVRNITATPAGLVRLGGSVDWRSTAWLLRYGAAPVEAAGGRRSHRAAPVSAR